MANTNNELKTYLEKNFGKVTVLDNGYFRAVDKAGNKLYINPNASPNINLVAYYPGNGGLTVGSTGGIIKQMEGNNPPDYCMILASNRDDPSNILKRTTNILNANNFSISSLFTSGNSGSGGTVLRRTADYLTAHPELASHTAIDINDGYNMLLKYDNYDVLKENNVPILFISPSAKYSAYRARGVNQFIVPFAKLGYNLLSINTDDWNHAGISNYCFVNRIPEYVLGLRDSIGNKYIEREPNYTVYKYNTKTGKYEKVDLSTIKISSIIDPSKLQTISVKDILCSDGYTLSAKDVEAVNDFSDLKDIQDLSIKFPNKLANAEAISSDMDLVLQAMNGIRLQIKNSNFLSNNNRGSLYNYRGPGLLLNINEYINKYYDYVGDLTDLLVEETESIQSVGQVMVDMDNDLAERGSALGTVKEIERTPKKRIKQRDLKEKEELAEQDDNNDNHNPIRNNKPVKEEKLEKYISYKRDDGSKLVIETDGNVVTSISYLYRFNNNEEAQNKFNEFRENYKDNDSIKDITISNKKVEIIFKPTAYENMTVEEIKNKYK